MEEFIREVENIIDDDKLIQKPIILVRGYIIEKSIYLEAVIDDIILGYLFKNEDSKIETIDKNLFKAFASINYKYRKEKSSKIQKLFHQEFLSQTRMFKKIEFLKKILKDIGINSDNLKNFDTFYDTLNEFFTKRNTVAHWKWGSLTGKDGVTYVKSGGAEMESIDNLKKIRDDYKRLKNNLDVIYFNKFFDWNK